MVEKGRQLESACDRTQPMIPTFELNQRSQTESKACINCGGDVDQRPGRGRPRIRCTRCSPVQLGLKGVYQPVARLNDTCSSAGCGVKLTGYATEKYCSLTCRTTTCNRQAQERRRDRSPRPCRTCGTVFAPAYGDTRKKFCSATCCQRMQHRTHSGGTHRVRARKFGRRYQPINKWKIFARDGWQCQLCGVPTPRRLSGTTHDRAPVLDHILPLGASACGGDHVQANVHCACRRCNQLKGAKPLGQLRMF